MQLSDYDFDLPKELVAQQPLIQRTASRMLAVDRGLGVFTDKQFTDFPAMLEPSDLLVLNNTRVFPARLNGTSETGAAVEIFLVEEIEPSTWITLAKPGKRLKPGKRIDFDEKLSAEVVDKHDDGKVIVRFDPGPFDEIVEKIGRTPLPPYIRREKDGTDTDRERYQTVFASRSGAIAAPTAGLHFSKSIFDEIAGRGADITHITLHVGYGTFEPVRAEELSKHQVMPERFEIGEEAAEKLERARREGRRIVAVGTTTTRTLESMIERRGRFAAESGRAGLTIVQGYKFKAINALLTNFHLPQSSLLILVATFGGHRLIMDAYRHAVASRYRFYSYGDCMFIA